MSKPIIIDIRQVPDVITLNDRQQKMVKRLTTYFIWVMLVALLLIVTLMAMSQQDLKFD